MRLIKAEPARYSVDEEQLQQLEKLLLSLEGQLLDGLIYQVLFTNCIRLTRMRSPIVPAPTEMY